MTMRPSRYPGTYPVGTPLSGVEGITGADFDGVDGPDIALTEARL